MFVPPGEKIAETKTCRLSGQEFIVTDKDLEFYDNISPIFGGKKYSVPPPTLCPDERKRRRLSFRNEHQLYHRTCDKTDKKCISIFSPEKPHRVYELEEWRKDDWSPHDYARDFDFNRGFFDQYQDLLVDVPSRSLLQLGKMINSEFTHDVQELKDCYMTFDGEQSEKCLYGDTFWMPRNCMDFLIITTSENCYEVVSVRDCQRLYFSQNCRKCSDSWFLHSCVGCAHCFGCKNLKNQKYHIFNEPHTPEEYAKKLSFLKGGISRENLEIMKAKSLEFWKTQPVRFMDGLRNQDVTGNDIDDSKESYECFDCFDLEGCKYCTKVGMGAKNSYDINIWGKSMMGCYECEGAGDRVFNNLFCFYTSSNSSNGLYSFYCKGVNHVFGCSNLTKASHCILNKSYSQAEYEALAGKIVDHMRAAGEWGEYFPHEMSPFGYNETVANDYFPMNEQQVKAKGWNWKEEEDKTFTGEKYEPLHITQYDPEAAGEETARANINAALEGTFVCTTSGRPFKLTKLEMAFYIENKLPLPVKHPDERGKDRFALRNPHKLWSRKCSRCDTAIQTSYAPDRPEEVLCAECYQKFVYGGESDD